MAQTSPPTSQQASYRPIAFALDAGGNLSAPISLKIRPEDLTRTEPSRIAVHQTLGRETSGWVDNFGPGLPTVNISGHTGWRATQLEGQDGVQAFESLNKMVMVDYHAEKQRAIDTGRDPATVKLIFIDMLDYFTWNVAPMNFVLRRSKSRPLLIQYNISMQAVSTNIDDTFSFDSFGGGRAGGLDSLFGALDTLRGLSDQIKSLVNDAVAFVDAALAPIAQVISTFVALSYEVFSIVASTVASVRNGFSSVANNLIGMAGDVAKIGTNVFRTIAAVANLPGDVKRDLMKVGAAFNEVSCILSNSLKPQGSYEDYDGLFGASNCSSTTGGRPESPYLGTNPFKQMQPEPAPVALSSAALASVNIVGRMDPVLQPMPLQEISRHLGVISAGLEFA